MACTVEFIEFVCTQLAEAGDVRSRKMFGDYMVYINEKPVVLACDNIAYVKIHPAIADLMTDAEKGFPYEGAKEHYILDIEHGREAVKVVRALEQALPYPKPKKEARN